MACDLLNKDWTTDEINARLGHKPSSRELDKYINFLALGSKKPQRKIYQNNLTKLSTELEETKDREKLLMRRTGKLKEDYDDVIKKLILIEKKLS